MLFNPNCFGYEPEGIPTIIENLPPNELVQKIVIDSWQFCINFGGSIGKKYWKADRISIFYDQVTYINFDSEYVYASNLRFYKFQNVKLLPKNECSDLESFYEIFSNPSDKNSITVKAMKISVLSIPVSNSYPTDRPNPNILKFCVCQRLSYDYTMDLNIKSLLEQGQKVIIHIPHDCKISSKILTWLEIMSDFNVVELHVETDYVNHRHEEFLKTIVKFKKLQKLTIRVYFIHSTNKFRLMTFYDLDHATLRKIVAILYNVNFESKTEIDDLQGKFSIIKLSNYKYD